MFSRGVRCLQRTSRRGPGGWSHSRVGARPSAGGNSSFDRHGQHYEEVDPRLTNWKLDRRRAGKMWDVGNAHRGGDAPPAAPTMQRAGTKDGTATENEMESKTWTGGEWSKRSTDSNRGGEYRLDHSSQIGRERGTLTRLVEGLVEATFKPKDADSRTFGGEGTSHRNEMKADLKYMDPRIVPFLHEELSSDMLRTVRQIMTPSGQATSRDLVKGRLVGILFFTESERSRAFMLALRDFHRRHAADFVVVCVSLAGKEMLDITRALGFYHCLRRDGGQWVERDSGLVVSTVQPLPRLIICDGTTGKKITDGGVTAVLAAPDTCFEEWRKGREGWEWWQVVYTFFIG